MYTFYNTVACTLYKDVVAPPVADCYKCEADEYGGDPGQETDHQAHLCTCLHSAYYTQPTVSDCERSTRHSVPASGQPTLHHSTSYTLHAASLLRYQFYG